MQGLPQPWTDDPAFATYRFCNVFRELDKTTVWIRENIRNHLEGKPHQISSMTAARYFNRIATLDKIKDILIEGWDADAVKERLKDHAPVVTGAYVVKTPNGMSKLEGVCSIVDAVKAHEHTIYHSPTRDVKRLEWLHSRLCEVPYVGPFMAYEIVSDLRHLDSGRHAPDIFTWANLGPGAVRGLGWASRRDPGRFTYPLPQKDVERVKDAMCVLQEYSTEPTLWPGHFPPWEMREVEHWLCEFDKWNRATRMGMRLKQLYTPGKET